MQLEGLSPLDQKILGIIKDNARLSYSEIGEQAGVSRVTVKNRMDALEEKGVIKGYQTIIDETCIQDGIHYVLGIEAYAPDFESVLEMVSREKTIRKVYIMSGDSRIQAEGFAASTRYIQTFIDKLYRSDSGVRRLGVHTVMSVIKDVDNEIEYIKYAEDKTNHEDSSQ